ncbi:Crp/Fnr family transcriptional regulator [Microvirga pudoricolor]|uniref:Crp/Fnr family transcriptional regulator n=1 Tax=Microvirga pudoricolor TaxID=2778729 RepID=UPI00194DC6C0|nr:Crp/Fnr family transcriptional regulator [Microvirga pudoricolor]MBM6595075.1 Crp/Fnr family transcriptional regulator [Microvirga pudoricolor]
MNPLLDKLEAFEPLPEADKRLLDSLVRSPQVIGPRLDLIHEGDAPTVVQLILVGFACRYKILPDGTRQIMAYLVPGDFCDLHVFILKEMDHSIATLSQCQVVQIHRPQILELMERPAIARAMWWAALVDEATLREWLVNIGARPAEQRIAHLLCELLLRLETVGLTQGGQYELPITQHEIGDTMGLSSVHVNRVLQRLRADGLITFKGSNLVILDIPRLKTFSGFNPNYLHLPKRNGTTPHSV